MIDDQIVSTDFLCFGCCMTNSADTALKPRETYHHGNLPDALVTAAANLLTEKGADGFSMREVARRVGVAVAAPSHHFGNSKGLLTAVATCGFKALVSHQRVAMEQAASPADKTVALCRTYVEMGKSHPGYAAVMFRWDLLDQDNRPYIDAASAAFDLLADAVRQTQPDHISAQTVENAAKTLWATMHGFVTLSMTDGPEADARIDFAVRTVLTGLRGSDRTG
jgi:AcrR family transcriptional regulator